MSNTQDPHQQEQQHIVVEEEEQQFSIAIVPEEGATIESEPALIADPSDKDQQGATATSSKTDPIPAAKQSRLSLAFHKISCGLCLHPLKNNSGVDYHQLVHTPTDEEGPFFGDDSDHDGTNHVEGGNTVVPREIMEEGNKESKAVEQHFLFEASSSASHAETTTHFETKEEHSLLNKQEQEADASAGQKGNMIPTFVEEFTVMEETVEEPTIVAREIAEEVPVQVATAPVDIKTTASEEQNVTAAVITPVVSPSSYPAPIRVAGPFAKLTKRSSPSSSPTPSSPTSSANSSPLLGRLGRFAKIIRPSETTTPSRSTSSQKVVESLQVVASRTESGQTHIEETTTTTTREVSSAQSTNAPLSAAVIEDKREQQQVPWTHATPPLPPTLPQQPQQQQQHINKRHSLALDTAAANFMASSSPMPIPGQSPVHPWTTHSPTLHQNDASIASQVTHTASASINSTRSVSRADRSSTLDSTVEGGGGLGSDAGSLNSSTKEGSASNSQQGEKGGFMSKTTKRRKSVMKKLGKIINNINTKPGKEGKEGKRVSRQGSMTLPSPLEMSPEAE